MDLCVAADFCGQSKREPVTPKPEPVTPKPEPVTPKPEPATPKPEPVTPKLAEQEPATPKPVEHEPRFLIKTKLEPVEQEHATPKPVEHEPRSLIKPIELEPVELEPELKPRPESLFSGEEKEPTILFIHPPFKEGISVENKVRPKISLYE